MGGLLLVPLVCGPPRSADDIQVEFIMLNPYVRQRLQHDGQGTYFLRFKVSPLGAI